MMIAINAVAHVGATNALQAKPLAFVGFVVPDAERPAPES